MRLHANLPYRLYGTIDIINIQLALSNFNSQIWLLDTTRQDSPYNPHQQTNSVTIQYCFGEPELDANFLQEDWVKKSMPDIKSGKIPIDKSLRRISTKQSFLEDISRIQEKITDTQLSLAVKPVVQDLEKKFKGISGLVILAKLPAKKEIKKHTDPGYYLSVVHRLHIPIITNDKCYFNINNNIVNMKEGCLYELNNQLEHSVKNDGDRDRTHLIVDIIPNKLIEQLKSRAYI